MRELLKGLIMFFSYYFIALIIAIFVKKIIKPKKEFFRKTLHIICAMSIFVLLYGFEKWYLSSLTLILFAIIVYPVLAYAQRYPKLMKLLTERRVGELKESLVIISLMMAGLIGIFWGVLGYQWKYIVLMSIMAWGFGDASAALIGKTWGRIIISRPFGDGKKTIEGTLGMLIISSIPIFIILRIFTALPVYLVSVVTIIIGSTSAITELISKRGWDTITVPFATATTAYIVLSLVL